MERRVRRVAIVHDALATSGGAGGAERVLQALVALYPDAEVFTTVYHPERMPGWMQGLRIRSSWIQALPFAKTAYQRYLPVFPWAIESLDLRQFDVVISCSHSVAKGVLVRTDAVHICYCYSPMRYAWDMHHEYLELEPLSPLMRRLIPWLIHALRLWDALGAARVDQFVAISQYVRRRIEKYYRRSADVVYPPVECLKCEVPLSDYYLVVGRLVPYKRVDLVVQAFNQLGWPLVIIGDGAARATLEQMACQNIRFLGRQSDDTVAAYLSGCRAFIFPGTEDFGIAPVEAQRVGRPVVAFNKGGAAETVIDGVSGVLFNEQTVDGLVKALKRLSRLNLDPETIAEAAERFSIARFHREMASIVDKVCDQKYVRLSQRRED